MSSIKNNVQLIGHIGKDTELKVLTGGTKVANASIAVTETYKTKSGDKAETTNWFNLEFWGKNAENAEKLLKKGAGVVINGSLKSESYEKDKVKHYVTKVVVDEFFISTYVTEKAPAETN